MLANLGENLGLYTHCGTPWHGLYKFAYWESLLIYLDNGTSNQPVEGEFSEEQSGIYLNKDPTFRKPVSNQEYRDSGDIVGGSWNAFPHTADVNVLTLPGVVIPFFPRTEFQQAVDDARKHEWLGVCYRGGDVIYHRDGWAGGARRNGLQFSWVYVDPNQQTWLARVYGNTGGNPEEQPLQDNIEVAVVFDKMLPIKFTNGYYGEVWELVPEPTPELVSRNVVAPSAIGNQQEDFDALTDPAWYVLDQTRDGARALFAVGVGTGFKGPRVVGNPATNVGTSGEFAANEYAQGTRFDRRHSVCAIYEVTVSGVPSDSDPDNFSVDITVVKSQAECASTVVSDTRDITNVKFVRGPWYVNEGTELQSIFSRPNLLLIPPERRPIIQNLIPSTIGPVPGDGNYICPNPLINVFENYTGPAGTEPGDPVYTEITTDAGRETDETGKMKWWYLDPYVEGQTIDLADAPTWEASQEYRGAAHPSPSDVRVGYATYKLVGDDNRVTDRTERPGTAGGDGIWIGSYKDADSEPIFTPNAWEEGVFYDWKDVVILGAETGVFYVSKVGTHRSSEFSEPNTGEVWEDFWERGLAANGTAWQSGRVYQESHIVEATVDGETVNYECVLNHLSTTDNEPGNPNSASWQTYWVIAYLDEGSGVTWENDVIYDVGDRVQFTPDRSGADTYTYTAKIQHSSVGDPGDPAYPLNKDPTYPPDPDDFDVEGGEVVENDYWLWDEGGDCGFVSSLLGVWAQFKCDARDEDWDFRFENTMAWACYEEDFTQPNPSATIVFFTADIHYQFQLTANADDPEYLDGFTEVSQEGTKPGGGTGPVMYDDQPTPTLWTGLYKRKIIGNEQVLYRLRRDGTPLVTVQASAELEIEGNQSWDETRQNYNFRYEPSGYYDRKVTFDGEVLTDLRRTFDVTERRDPGPPYVPGGEDRGLFDAIPRAGSGENDWLSDDGYLPERILNPENRPFGRLAIRIDNALEGENRFNEKSPKWWHELIHLDADSVGLRGLPLAVTLEQIAEDRPTREDSGMEWEIEAGIPTPSIVTAIYTNRLVGPWQIGRATRAGGGQDGTGRIYKHILEANDMPWKQYGVYGPGIEDSVITTLTRPAPADFEAFMENGDYGDDINCTYDPRTGTLIRNDSYRVCWV